MKKTILSLLLYLLSGLQIIVSAQSTQTIQTVTDNLAYFAITNDNTLYGWGEFEDAQLGNGTTHGIYNNPVKIMNNTASITCSFWGTFAIKTDGSLWQWGSSPSGELILAPTKIMEDVLQIKANQTILVQKNDKTLWGWGKNENGEILPTDIPYYKEPQLIMSDVASMDCGTGFTVVLKTDGSVWTFGQNARGSLGDGTLQSRKEPKKILEHIKRIFVFHKTCFAIDDENRLWWWGLNYPLRDDKDASHTHTPTLYAENVKAIDQKSNYAILLKTDGSLWAYAAPGTDKIKIADYSFDSPYQITKDDIHIVDFHGTLLLTDRQYLFTLDDVLYETNGSTLFHLTKKMENIRLPENIDLLAQKHFTDISDKPIEMQKAINALNRAGIINGTSRTEFSPDKPLTRAEFAALPLRLTGQEEAIDNGGFSDVTKDDWYFGVAGASKAHHIISGFADNTFRGDIPITLEQTLALLSRILQKERKPQVPDVQNGLLFQHIDSASLWARQDIGIGIANGLFYDTELIGLNQTVTRGSAAIFLYRLYNKI